MSTFYVKTGGIHGRTGTAIKPSILPCRRKNRLCPVCKGSGRASRPCDNCNNTGRVPYMSTTGTRLPLAEAREIADMLLSHIEGEAHVVGSVRRIKDYGLKDYVGDIEIALHVDAVVDLDVAASSLFPGTYDTVKGGKKGWRFWQLRHRERGYNIDLFRFRDHNRGSIMLIRTGPPDFSRQFMVCLKRRGLRHEAGYIRDKAGTPISCPTEKFAFALAGWKWLEPEDRR